MTDARLQYVAPLLIPVTEGTPRALERVALSHGTDDQKYSEGWLQRLIFRFPQCLPAVELEPGFGRLTPVGLEMPTPAGFVDNVYVTPEGNLVIVECKLWRNPEARREVVAQIIDYAHSMARWSYQQLQDAVRKSVDAEGNPVGRDLYDFVRDADGTDEAAFIDAVSRNLRLGRLLLLIVGDGIREGAETLVDYLQMHAGFHFTLGIVEAAVFRLPDGDMIFQPRVLARTVNIERGIVRIVGDNVIVEAIPAPPGQSTAPRTTSISEEQFFEELSARHPDLVGALRTFLDRGAEIGVFAEPVRRSLMLRWIGPNGLAFALGGVTVDGELTTYSVNWTPDSIGRIDLGNEYLERLAALVGGQVRKTPKAYNWYVVKGNKPPRAVELVCNPVGWVAIVEDYTNKLREALG